MNRKIFGTDGHLSPLFTSLKPRNFRRVSLIHLPKAANHLHPRSTQISTRTRMAPYLDDSLPSLEDLAKADACEIFDSKSERVKFGQLRASEKTTILIFVRHWNCGLCSGYLMELQEKPYFKPLFDETSEESKRFEVIIIGHGQPSGIENYRGFAGDIKCQIFADPKKQLYKSLGVTNKTTDLGSGNHPKHARSESALKMVIASSLHALKSGRHALTGGEVSQQGAEFIFDPSGQPIFAHRMASARDRTEYEVLASKAGLKVEAIAQ